MAGDGFTDAQWDSINQLDPDNFGLPVRSNIIFTFGTFNMLKLGKANDDAKRWDFLTKICERFDFLAIQEIMDDLDGLQRLQQSLPNHFDVIVSVLHPITDEVILFHPQPLSFTLR